MKMLNGSSIGQFCLLHNTVKKHIKKHISHHFLDIYGSLAHNQVDNWIVTELESCLSRGGSMKVDRLQNPDT